MSVPSWEDDRTAPQYRSTEKKKPKKSNKIKNLSPYWCWFLEAGRAQFLRKYGRDFSHDCEDDKALITNLWEPVKATWEKKVKTKGVDMKGIICQFRSEDGNASHNLIRRRATDHRPPNFPLPNRSCESIEQYDIRGRRESGKQDLLDRLSFFDAQKTDFSTVVLQFIAVNPYTVSLSSIGDILVYPAEIAVTHFTLADGKSSCWSKLVSFHSNMFYGGGVPAWDQINVVRNCMPRKFILAITFHVTESNGYFYLGTSLDVPLKEAVGVAPQEVWKMLWGRRSPRAITVCDAAQMLIVDRALFFLASTAGESQLPFCKELVSTMITAQDLVASLALHKAKITRTKVPDILTDQSIEKEFKRLRETCRCCSYHVNRPPNHPSRQVCAVAKIDILIDVIYTLCLSGDLANFRALYNADVHFSDTVDIRGFVDGDDRNCVRASTTRTVGLDEVSPDHETEEESPRGFVLNYRVVKAVPKMLPEQAKITVDLKPAISNLLRESSFLPITMKLI